MRAHLADGKQYACGYADNATTCALLHRRCVRINFIREHRIIQGTHMVHFLAQRIPL